MRANLQLMSTSIQSLISYFQIFLITSLLNLIMATCQRETTPPERTSFNFHLKQQNILRVRYSQGNFSEEGETARIWLHELFFQRLSAIIAFKAAFSLHFRCQNILRTVLIKGYTRINEKVPCSRIINKYLIKGMGKPEAQILSFILISIILL